MSYGLEIYDSSGNLILENTDNITRIIYSTYTNTNGSRILSGVFNDSSSTSYVGFSIPEDINVTSYDDKINGFTVTTTKYGPNLFVSWTATDASYEWRSPGGTDYAYVFVIAY